MIKSCLYLIKAEQSKLSSSLTTFSRKKKIIIGYYFYSSVSLPTSYNPTSYPPMYTTSLAVSVIISKSYKTHIVNLSNTTV